MEKEDRKQENYVVSKIGNPRKDPICEVTSVEWKSWDQKPNGWWNKNPIENTKEELLNRINRIINKPYKFREDAEKYFELVKIYQEKFDKEYKTYNFTITADSRLITYCDPPVLQCMECGKSINRSRCMITLDECACGPMFFNDIILLHHRD